VSGAGVSEPSPKYLVRDQEGHVYGPADEALLREWVQEGRIVAGMAIAPRETREWVDAAAHPAVADLLQARRLALSDSPAPAPGVLASDSAGSVEIPQVSHPATPLPQAPSPLSAPQRPEPIPFQRPSALPEITYTPPPVHNTLGILSFIFGIAGMTSAVGMCIPFCVCFALPVNGLVNLTAVVLGILALSQIRADPARYTSRGFAVSGLVMGSVMLLLYLIGIPLGALFFSYSFHP
jgi:hypothetical protein